MTHFQTMLVSSALSVVALLSSCANQTNQERSPTQTQILNEEFESFYNRFKNDTQFKFERTVFPIKATFFHMDTPEQSDVTVVETWTKQAVQNEERHLFVNENIVRSEGYAHQIKKQRDGKFKVEIGKINSEPACGYLFEKRDGGWYLVEFMNYWAGGSRH